MGEEEKAGAPKPEERGAGGDHQAPSQEKESGDGAGGCGEALGMRFQQDFKFNNTISTVHNY